MLLGYLVQRCSYVKISEASHLKCDENGLDALEKRANKKSKETKTTTITNLCIQFGEKIKIVKGIVTIKIVANNAEKHAAKQ